MGTQYQQTICVLLSLSLVFNCLCSRPRYHSSFKDTYNLLNYAENLNGVAVCVEQIGGIQKPFKCLGHCDDFPDMELITTFHPKKLFDFSTTGFLAIDHKRKQFWHVFRGTASLTDGISNLRLERQPLVFWDNPEFDCPGCEAHEGFLTAYNDAYDQIRDVLNQTLAQYPDYQIIVTGHSFGGASSFLHGINLKSQGMDPLVITSGQPLTGNKALADFNDKLFFGDNPDFTYQGPDRRFYRVTHKDDLVPRLPFWNPFHHSGGEVYIDYPLTNPPLRTLKICDGQQNPRCSFSTSLITAALLGTLQQAHFMYFTFFSLVCGVNIAGHLGPPLQ